MILAEYCGGSSSDYKNYKLSFINKKDFKSEWNLQELPIDLFNYVIVDFYKNREFADDFKSFVSDMILNQYRNKLTHNENIK